MQRTNHQKAFLFMIGFILVICFISQNTALALNTTLAWEKNPALDNVTKYYVYYSTSSFTNGNLPATYTEVDPAVNGTFPGVSSDDNMIHELTLPDLTAGQRYYFGVTAVNHPDDTDLESSLSLLVNTVIHNPADAGTPENAVLNSSDITSSQVVLYWNKPSDDLGVVRFTLTRTGSTLATIDATAANNYSYTDSTVAPNTTYTYRVRSYDAAGHYSNSNQVSVTTESGVITDTTPPSVPGNLASQSVLARSITIRWNASTDIGGSGVDKYLVYQGSTTSTPVEVDHAGNNQHIYTFNNLTPDTEYTFWVSAVDNSDNESDKAPDVNGLSLTTPQDPPPDTTPPETPGNLLANDVTATSFTLSWDACEDNQGGSGLREYIITRNNQTINVGNTINIQHHVTGLQPNTSYTFQVCAVDNSGNRAVSADITIRTASGGGGGGEDDDSGSGGGCFIGILGVSKN